MKNRNSMKPYVIIIVILLVLFVTNPSKADYMDWMNGKIAKDSGTFGTVITELFAGPNADMSTERTNLLFFSIYHTDTRDSKVTHLGIFKFFVRVN